MPQFKVAHIREQGNDMIIVPLASSFGSRGSTDQNEIILDLEAHAHAAGLAGRVVAVWDDGGGRTRFIAPSPWVSFFEGISLRWVWRNINKNLSW
jgi:hypothetical protein